MVAEALAFPLRREPGFLRSFCLAALMHALLVSILLVGVRFQSHVPTTVELELWETPPPPAPQPEVKPEPAPPPPPQAEPEKPVAKPDIALQEKPKPKPKPKPKAEPKRDRDFEKRMREQLAVEQKAVAEQQRVQDEQRRERELKALIAKQQATARAKSTAVWEQRIQGKIKSRIPVTVVEAVSGNPDAVFSVSLLPTGEVLTVRMKKSSGNRAYDEAVERAILGASPLPKPDDPSVFQRQLELTFRPRDKPGS